MRIVLVFSVISLLFSCQNTPSSEHLLGAWEVDSTYSYYNGFGYTEKEEGSDWATYVYETEGIMKEIKYGSYQTYFFELAADSLTVRPTQGGDETTFQILQLNTQQMVLKKTKSPLFGGNNQERYEIRYFSKTEVPSAEAVPFSDPRQ